MIIVAVDPGLSGACAVLDHNGLRAVFDLPTMRDDSVGEDAMVKRKIDARALTRELLRICPLGTSVFSVLEKVGAVGGKKNRTSAQLALVRAAATVETVLECLNWSPNYTTPQTWKRTFGLVQARGLTEDEKQTDTERKRASLAVARKLYPDADLGLAKHHNRAEAVLIAHWARSKFA